MLTIRTETPYDHATVHRIHRKAFNNDYEPQLVDRIRRSSEHIPELSIVAELDGRLVGHVLFSRVAITTSQGDLPTLTLAPVAVLPDCQHRRIGSALVEEGLKECRILGHPHVIVLGHPEYYPRFGFTVAAERGITTTFDAPREAFMVAELIPGSLDGVTGVVTFPPVFDEQ